jgi:hypothetical protein
MGCGQHASRSCPGYSGQKRHGGGAFPARRGVDLMARVFAEKLAAKWGKPVVVENRPGAGALLGGTGGGQISGRWPHFAADHQHHGDLTPRVAARCRWRCRCAYRSGVSGRTCHHAHGDVGQRRCGGEGLERSHCYGQQTTGHARWQRGQWLAHAPAGIPSAVRAQINADINEALKFSDVREKLATAGLDVLGGSEQSLADFMRADRQGYSQLARELNIKADGCARQTGPIFCCSSPTSTEPITSAVQGIQCFARRTLTRWQHVAVVSPTSTLPRRLANPIGPRS